MAAVLSVGLISCEKEDEKDHHHEEESITTVEIAAIKTGTSDTTFTKWSDTDGDGGNNPVIETLNLDSSSSYTFAFRFLHEAEDESEDITEEIREENNEHLVCTFNNSGMVLTPTDFDDNNLPVGLEQSVAFNAPQNGELTITLKHQPDVKNGSCDVGATDIDVTFPVMFN